MNGWEDVVRYWLDELGEDGWYAGGPEIDARIRARFEADWHEAMAGRREHWRAGPRRTLAYLILTDQMPRNMFRGTAQAYASDRLARAAAMAGIAQGWDLRTDLPQRQFFYLPLEHSEYLSDQERCVRLMQARLGDGESLLHARAHRDIIRRFGRFPFRNAHLGRRSSAEEEAFLAAGGYGAVVEALKRGVPMGTH